jgi:saccharopine dehydrogenase (NADP+, L-glutamate forming)/spermidine synthase
MSNNILVLGAGLVSRPLVRYLLQQPSYTVTVATRTKNKAKKIINKHPDGKAICLDVSDNKLLDSLISKSDLIVSLLPYKFHIKVANICIKYGKSLVTTSYVSEGMKALDKKAKDAGVILLNECGLDPGIDHMSAMRVIHSINKRGGKIISFKSTTGALPSHESNNNPFGYKFSWSPRGVLLASKNSAKYLDGGQEISIPSEELFENYYLHDIPELGTFENYPNRDSVNYKNIYGLKYAKTVYRGTFRMPGWCETLKNIVDIGWLSDDLVTGFNGETYGDLTRKLIGAKAEVDIIDAAAKHLGLKPYSTIIKRLSWLGLFSDELLPKNGKTPLDYINYLSLKKMKLEKDDKDMIVMHHEFIVQLPSRKEYITSTLVDYGIPGGATAVSRTVAFPAAIAVKLIRQDKIGIKGVHIPVIPEIYNPILNELEGMGIKFKEKIEPM